MSDAELPPASPILQALHAIRKEIAGTNARLDATREELSVRIDQTNTRLEETNRRLDETNEKLDQLRVFTVQKLTDLNAKVDRLGERADVLGDRLENILTGQLGNDVRDLKARMQAVENRLDSLAAREDSPPYPTKPTDET